MENTIASADTDTSFKPILEVFPNKQHSTQQQSHSKLTNLASMEESKQIQYLLKQHHYNLNKQEPPLEQELHPYVQYSQQLPLQGQQGKLQDEEEEEEEEDLEDLFTDGGSESSVSTKATEMTYTDKEEDIQVQVQVNIEAEAESESEAESDVEKTKSGWPRFDLKTRGITKSGRNAVDIRDFEGKDYLRMLLLHEDDVEECEIAFITQKDNAPVKIETNPAEKVRNIHKPFNTVEAEELDERTEEIIGLEDRLQRLSFPKDIEGVTAEIESLAPAPMEFMQHLEQDSEEEEEEGSDSDSELSEGGDDCDEHWTVTLKRVKKTGKKKEKKTSPLLNLSSLKRLNVKTGLRNWLTRGKSKNFQAQRNLREKLLHKGVVLNEEQDAMQQEYQKEWFKNIQRTKAVNRTFGIEEREGSWIGKRNLRSDLLARGVSFHDI